MAQHRHRVGHLWPIGHGRDVRRIVFLSEDFIKLTPFGEVPRIPAEDFAPLPLVVLSVIALVLATIGFWRLRTRDVMPE